MWQLYNPHPTFVRPVPMFRFNQSINALMTWTWPARFNSPPCVWGGWVKNVLCSMVLLWMWNYIILSECRKFKGVFQAHHHGKSKVWFVTWEFLGWLPCFACLRSARFLETGPTSRVHVQRKPEKWDLVYAVVMSLKPAFNWKQIVHYCLFSCHSQQQFSNHYIKQ